MLKFQEGGDVDSGDDEDIGGGALSMDPSQLMMSLFLNQNTASPESKEFAKRYLEQATEDLKKPATSGAMAEIKANAEATREALRKAQARLQGRPYPASNPWLAISEGLGRSTKSGSMGESMSNLAGALRSESDKRRAFEQARDTEANQLDLDMAKAGGPEAAAQLQLDLIQQRLKGELAKESFKTLAKTTSGKQPGSDVIPTGAKNIDRVYVKDEYTPFVLQGGSAKAAQGLETLGFAVRQLKSGKDYLTGPILGTLASTPYIGPALQEIFTPQGARVRDLVLQTVQESLRPILGSQFTQQEGERLMNRVFNPRLEEKDNAVRVEWLIQQLQRANDAKVAAAHWYETHHTMFGYKGKYKFNVNDFTPPDSVGKGSKLSQGAQDSLREGTMLSLPEDPVDPQQHAKGGPVRLQEGGNPDLKFAGPKPDDDPTQMDSPIWDKLQSLYQQSGVAPDVLSGGLGGLTLEAMLASLQRRVPKTGGVPKAERQVIDAIHNSGQSPVGKAEDVKRGRRAGVPSTLMDTDSPGIRALTNDALTYGGAEADEALTDLRNRVGGSRERTSDQINRGMKPYEYYDLDNKLIGQILDTTPRTVKQPVFDKYQGLPMDPVISQIMETPEGKKAMGQAFRFIQNVPGKKAGKTDLQGMITKPSLEFYDLIVDGFDQNIAAEEKGGERTKMGDIIRDLRQMFVDRVDGMAPEYKDVRQQAGADLEVRDALHQGKNFQKLAPEQLEQIAAGLGFHEKNAFRTGIAQNLYEMLDKSSSDNFNAAQKIVGSPRTMAQIKPFFDNAAQLKIFQTALEKESELMRVGKSTLDMGDAARLKRAQNLVGLGEYAAKRAPGFRFTISPLGWALRLMRDRPKMTEKTADKVLEVLQRGDPSEMDAFIKSSQRLAKLRGFRGARRGAAAALGAGLAGAAAYFGGNGDAEEQP